MTPRQQERIRKLAPRHTVPQIAARIGVSMRTVYRFCREHGIEARSALRKLPADLATIRREVEAAGSVEVVARRYGVTLQAVYYRLAKEWKGDAADRPADRIAGDSN